MLSTNTIIKIDEKYRPKTFADLIGNQQIITDVRKMVDGGNIPHMLFAGVQGTGKTSLALVVVKELFGNKKRSYIEINASDDNGIDVVRNRIKSFAKQSGTKNNVAFRVCILDEIDNMTRPAQQALRRTMELFPRCRFILICNYKHKMIDPILSRCTVFDFGRISTDAMIPRLAYICDLENIDIESEAIELIATKSNGDMRSAINSYIERIRIIKNTTITIKHINKLRIDTKTSEAILKEGLNGRFVNGRQLLLNGLKRGYNLRQVINEISSAAIANGFPEMMKGDICLACLESEKLILDGCTENLVIAGLIARLVQIGKSH